VVPIVGKLAVRNDRIAVLQRQIRYRENHRSCYVRRYRDSDGSGSAKGSKNDEFLEQLKAELAELLEEEAKADKLRNLPLYSSKITGFKFVCGTCYDKAYMMASRQRSRKNL
jgi:hypothetical protein